MKEKIRQIKAGYHILHEWLGKGGFPVPAEQAQARANVCAQCPKNYSGPWLWNMATAMAIKAHLQLRTTLNIKLENEDKLHVCEVCGCKLHLKVHVPFEHIYRHTSPELFAKYPNNCWQLTELNQYKK